MSTMSNVPLSPCEQRLRSIPWHALVGLAPLVTSALDSVLTSNAPAERAIDRLLRTHKSLSSLERQAVAEAVFGVALWRRRIAAQSGASRPTSLEMLGVFLRDVAGQNDAESIVGISLPAALPIPTKWADRYSMPSWLAAEIDREVGAEAEVMANALNLPAPICLRANRLLTTRDALAQALSLRGVKTRAGQFAPDCLVVTSPRPNLYALAGELEGHFEVQDEGSQMLAELVDLKSGDEVIDLCAGAGGKTLQLSAAVGPLGRIHAFDVDRSKLERLQHRASRSQAKVHIYFDGLPMSLSVPRVLIDAPCSELGALRRGPDMRWRISPDSLNQHVSLQIELIEQGLRHLAPGGRLVYATCTFRREENEAVVAAALSRRQNLRLVRPSVSTAMFDSNGFFKTFPHRHGTDGFFAAVLQCEGG